MRRFRYELSITHRPRFLLACAAAVLRPDGHTRWFGICRICPEPKLGRDRVHVRVVRLLVQPAIPQRCGACCTRAMRPRGGPPWHLCGPHILRSLMRCSRDGQLWGVGRSHRCHGGRCGQGGCQAVRKSSASRALPACRQHLLARPCGIGKPGVKKQRPIGSCSETMHTYLEEGRHDH